MRGCVLHASPHRRIKWQLGSVCRGVLTNEKLYCILLGRLIAMFTWEALIEVSELPHMKDDIKFVGAH